jgi:hypothetical protein
LLPTHDARACRSSNSRQKSFASPKAEVDAYLAQSFRFKANGQEKPAV